MQRMIGIVAMTPDRIIGANGSLPWHLPADLAFFKRTTTGHPIVMGRKTYESIGRPLPNRRNIVLTKNIDWSAPGVEAIHSPGDLHTRLQLGGPVFIIGGAEIYRAFLPIMDELLVTHVHARHPGDTQFPAYEDAYQAVEILEETPEFTVRRWQRQS
jgi:dihydrofolate reductase